MRAFVMSIEALATLVMAFGAIALIYANAGGGASGAEMLANEMQAHDVAWVAGANGVDGGEMAWLADGLGGCVKIQNDAGEREFGTACSADGAGNVFSAGFTEVGGAGFGRGLVKLEKR